jgi:hypothetical protein
MRKTTFNNKVKLYILFIFILALATVGLFFYRSAQELNSRIEPIAQDFIDQKIYETVELKTQKDFKLIGEPIFSASGFEPGFSVKLNLAGTKFGIDMDSSYGETKYVGYLDLFNQSTTTKVFTGNVLDKQDKIQTLKMTITEKICYEASGDTLPYTVDVSVAKEKVTGCGKIIE